jgi:ComF family protein
MGILEILLEAVYPSGIYCISCGSMIDSTRDYALCDSCMKSFHWAGMKTCGKCGKILADDYRHGLCWDCRQFGHDFDKGYTCVQYGLLERGVLMDYKYRGKPYIGRQLGKILYDRMEAEDVEYDIVVPVPMHEKRRAERGYNQAEVMAGVLARKKGVPCAGGMLVRKKETAAMKGLGQVERYENMKNVFAVSDKNHYTIAGKRILLVDDIYTTGSTLDACSRVLKDAGAEAVYVLTFACGANIPPAEMRQHR